MADCAPFVEALGLARHIGGPLNTCAPTPAGDLARWLFIAAILALLVVWWVR